MQKPSEQAVMTCRNEERERCHCMQSSLNKNDGRKRRTVTTAAAAGAIRQDK
jgi:hypothetical protein